MIGQTILKALSDPALDLMQPCSTHQQAMNSKGNCEYTIDQTNVEKILPTLKPLLNNVVRHKLFIAIKPISIDGKDALAINVNVWHPEFGAMNFSGIKLNNRLNTHTAQHYYF